MLKFNTILGIAVTVLIALNFYLVQKIQSNRALVMKQIGVSNELEKAYDKEDNINRNTTDVLMKMIVSEGAKINQDVLLTDINGIKIPISQLLNEKDIKVYYIPEHACDVCYDYLTEWLKELPETKQQEIITFCPSTKIRDVSSFFKDENINVMVYGVEERLGLIPEDGYAPFFFKLDEDFRCQNLLIPVKDKPVISDKYLTTVFSK